MAEQTETQASELASDDMSEQKLTTRIKNSPVLTTIPRKYRSAIREKAIDRARTRIIVAGSNPKEFSQEDLEIVVREEEDKLKGWVKEKGLLAVLAFFGIHFFG